MAITIIKEPSGIYPAYNDSFIEFESDLFDNNRAEITIFPNSLFPNTFSIFPNLQGRYLFNLKEFVKFVFNQDGFEDKNFFDNAFYKSISGTYLTQSLSIEVFNNEDSETISKTYEFFKSVKQAGEYVFENKFQLLNNSKNGVDYYLTYFEGFPFHFDIQRVVFSVGKKIKIINKNDDFEAIEMTPNFTGSFRFNIDRSENLNWTSGGLMTLSDGVNNLEIYEDGEFRTNVFLKKKKPCSGVYLKWWNSNGGFSHWLFDEFHSEKIKGKDIDLINSNNFENVGSFGSEFKSIGKTASRSLKIRTVCDQKEAKELRSLFYSPLIQYYTSKNANKKGVFIDVQVEETYQFNNKKGNQEFVIEIELPQLITARL